MTKNTEGVKNLPTERQKSQPEAKILRGVKRQRRISKPNFDLSPNKSEQVRKFWKTAGFRITLNQKSNIDDRKTHNPSTGDHNFEPDRPEMRKDPNLDQNMKSFERNHSQNLRLAINLKSQGNE